MRSPDLTPNQQRFATYLAGLWTRDRAVGFVHRYRISRSRHWRTWRERVGEPVDHWWCESLSEAAARYSWADAIPGLTFEALSNRLQSQLATEDAEAVRRTCLELFKWGGVARSSDDKSRRWIEAQAANGNLCASLRDGVRALQVGSSDDLLRFDGANLPMNAAMTKIYAAIDPDNVMIYDGRVGAALGLLTCKWLASVGRHSVPSDLAFRWGAKQGDHAARNPSSGTYSFSSLYLPSSRDLHQDRAWAAVARKASQICAAAAALTNGAATVREIERALFMIGYDVRGSSPLPTLLPTAE